MSKPRISFEMWSDLKSALRLQYCNSAIIPLALGVERGKQAALNLSSPRLRHNTATTPSHYNHRPFAETLMRFREFLVKLSIFPFYTMETHISKISNFTRKIGALWRFCPFNFQLSLSGKTRRLRNSAKWPRSVATATDQEKKTNCP